jgi:hypothetical protein
MTQRGIELGDLQESVRDRSGFSRIEHYFAVADQLLILLGSLGVTRIASPHIRNYIFSQFPEQFGHRITRPLNADLFIEDRHIFKDRFEKFVSFLGDLALTGGQAHTRRAYQELLNENVINSVVYTAQQAVGCIADSFPNANQARKRIGQIFEQFIKIMIKELGLECEPRTIKIPIPGYEDYKMSYELDVVFSREKIVLASETEYLGEKEIVGSVKTTSKDRMDKVFLDKYLLKKLLGRDIPVVAVFLHDVQRAQRGQSIFGINSTFKRNHFLGYTIALNPLDGVYYIDPRPEMLSNKRLREQIKSFQRFLTHDLWTLSGDPE